MSRPSSSAHRVMSRFNRSPKSTGRRGHDPVRWLHDRDAELLVNAALNAIEQRGWIAQRRGGGEVSNPAALEAFVREN